jgi:hypothetical protein
MPLVGEAWQHYFRIADKPFGTTKLLTRDSDGRCGPPDNSETVPILFLRFFGMKHIASLRKR